MKENNTRRALGKGLEQLFNSEQLDFNSFEKEIVSSATINNDVREIDLSEIRSNPYQPRTEFNQDKLNELADSIKEHGLLEPVILKKSIKGYELVAGERRCKAARIAGLTTIPAIVKDFTDQEMMELALIENVQREDLNPIEEAKAYKNIMEKLNMTQDECAKRFSKSRSYVTNLLGLLTLPASVQSLVVDGRLSASHARILSKLEDDEEIVKLANRVCSEGMSVHALEDFSKTEDIPKKKPTVRVNNFNPTYKSYENTLREVVGTKVSISKNKVVIPFDSDADLNRIMEILNIEIGD